MTNSNFTKSANSTNFDDLNDFSGFQQKCIYCQNNGIICVNKKNKTSLCELEYCPRFESSSNERPSNESTRVRANKSKPTLFYVKRALGNLQKIEQALELISRQCSVNLLDMQMKMIQERDRLIINDANYLEAWEILCSLGAADRKSFTLPDENDDPTEK